METPTQILQRIYSSYDTNASDIERRYKDINAKTTFTKQTLYNIEEGKTKSITARIASILKEVFPDLNFMWLTSGKGEMTEVDNPFARSDTEPDNTIDKNADAMDQLSRVQKNNGKKPNITPRETIFHTVDAYILPVKGRLGLGSSYYADSYFERELDKTTVSITEKPLNANRFILAEFEGESMTNGKPEQIPDGSWLILAERKRGEDWESNMEGKIMGFFDRDDNFTVKKVKKHNTHHRYVILEALNPDKSQPENQDRELEIKNCWAIYDYINKLS